MIIHITVIQMCVVLRVKYILFSCMCVCAHTGMTVWEKSLLTNHVVLDSLSQGILHYNPGLEVVYWMCLHLL